MKLPYTQPTNPKAKNPILTYFKPANSKSTHLELANPKSESLKVTSITPI